MKTSEKKVQQRALQVKQEVYNQGSLLRNSNSNENSSASSRKRSLSRANKGNVSSLQDKPVTFGHPIKSSGYDCQP